MARSVRARISGAGSAGGIIPASTRPTLTIGLANYGSLFPPDEWYRFVDLARAVEDAGIDRIVVVDHVVMGPHTENYAWGTFPVPPEAPWFEPLIMLAAIASATTRVRLATGILIAPLRPAALLAKQAATLDVSVARPARPRRRYRLATRGVRRGRRRLRAARGQLLSDTLAACKVLWRDTPAAIDTPTLSFHESYCAPKPLQPGGVPLWIGGALHARNLERMVGGATRGSRSWAPRLADIADGSARSLTPGAAAGRDPSVLQVQAPLRIERGERRPAGSGAQHGVGARSRRRRRDRRARDLAERSTATRPTRRRCSQRSSAGSPTHSAGRERDGALRSRPC